MKVDLVGHLRSSGHGQIVKLNMKVRAGKGSSLDELKSELPGDKVEKVVVSDLCKVIKDVLGDKNENDRLSSARMKMIVLAFHKTKKKKIRS